MVEFDDLQEENNPIPEIKKSDKSSSIGRMILYFVISVMIIALCYFGYGYLSNENAKAVDEKAVNKPARILQIDVLNGCGAKGIGAKFTDYLRTQGFDVVESKNYKTFQVVNTLVIDRIGDLEAARRVALAIGVKEKNVVQQINPDYFVDVSVVIGKDYNELNFIHK